jgi:hypothetical protein
MNTGREIAGGTSFGRSRFVRWALTPLLVVFVVAMPALQQDWTSRSVAILGILEFMSAALLAGLWLPSRYGHWAFRALAACIFFQYLSYFVDEWFFGGHPLKLIESLGQPSPRNALLGLMIFGLPGLRYAVVGRLGPAQHGEDSDGGLPPYKGRLNGDCGPVHRDRPPSWAWPLIPFVLPVVLLIMIPLGIAALISIPYFALYPDRHAHLYDFEGTAQQRARLASWRAGYARLSVWGRLKRAIKLARRRSERNRRLEYIG